MTEGRGANAFRLSVCAFSALVLAVAAYANRPFPGLALSGEGSAGTWLSSALLAAAATLSLTAARGDRAWYLFSLFFALLALDERFMFHERLGRMLAFAFPHPGPAWKAMAQAPVLAGALAGMTAARFLWRRLGKGARRYLLAAAGLGSASVALDVTAAGAFPEDALKLLAEMALVCSLAEAPFGARTR